MKAAERRFRALAVAAAALLAGPDAIPASAPLSLPPGAELRLPADLKGSVEWVVPPVGQARPGSDFEVDKTGLPWFSHEGRVLSCPVKRLFAGVHRPFVDFTFLSDGQLMVCTENGLGHLTTGSRIFSDTKDTFPILELVKDASFSLDGPRIFSGEGGALYLTGRDRRGAKHGVFVLRAKGGRVDVVKLADSAQPARWVAGDGQRTFIAYGPFVVEVRDGRSAPAVVYRHPKEDIVELAYSKEAGLFYSTTSEVGYLQDFVRFDFLVAPRCRLRLRGDALYIALGDSAGVMKVGNLPVFKRFVGRR